MRRFTVVPVIDLMGGSVVHAKAGERDRYRPIQGSVVTGSAEPLRVVADLLALAPFPVLYIADLDAIRKTGDHMAILRALGAAFPGLELWVDAGFADARSCASFRGTGLGRPVLGSESQSDTSLLEGPEALPDLVLSLDYKGDTPLGPPRIFADPGLWPDRLVVMTLARVGSGQGPDMDKLKPVLAKAGERAVLAAGGVRDGDDLTMLAAAGCAGVLVASAIHDGRLGPVELQLDRTW